MFSKAKIYTADRKAVAMGGEGPYSATEAANNRMEFEPYFADRTEHGYRISLYTDPQKTLNGISVTERFDFSKYTRLGDIGGVPFFQARVILDRNPHLIAILTDYDAASVKAIEEIGIFAGHRVAVLDAMAGDFSILDGCDIITMWGVDFALTDESLVKLFQYIAAQNTTLLMGAVSAPFGRMVSKRVKQGIYDAVGPARFNRRSAGWLRSNAYMDRLLAKGGCKKVSQFTLGGGSASMDMMTIKRS